MINIRFIKQQKPWMLSAYCGRWKFAEIAYVQSKVVVRGNLHDPKDKAFIGCAVGGTFDDVKSAMDFIWNQLKSDVPEC